MNGKNEKAQDCVQKSFDRLLAFFKKEEDRKAILEAFHIAEKYHRGVFRKSGEPYILHPLQVALIIVEDFQYPDPPLVIAALLHDLIEDTSISKKEIENIFGSSIAGLVDGLTKIDKFTFTRKNLLIEANAKKLIRSVAGDLRVMVVKLADRMNNLTSLHVFGREKRKRIASESLEFFALFAKRLGIFAAYTHITDYSLHNYYGDRCKALKEKIDKRLKEEEPALKKLLFHTKSLLSENHIDGRIEVLEKGVHSFYDFERQELKDVVLDERSLYRIAIILKEDTDAYKAMGCVHSRFAPLRNSIIDLIALPKRNGFQSLFSHVRFGDKVYQFQFRTELMDEIARSGILYYWKKFGTYATPEYFAEFKDILLRLSDEESHDISLSAQELIRESEIVVFVGETPYRFPEGDRILDLAYEVSVERGEYCIGALNRNKLKTVYDFLEDGEIYTLQYDSARLAIRNDWLLYAKSAIARPLIQKWLNARRRTRSILVGEWMVEHALHELGIEFEKFISSDTLQGYLHLNETSLEDFYARIATGMTQLREVLYYFDEPSLFEATSNEPYHTEFLKRVDKCTPFVYTVTDIEDYFLKFPHCCFPLPESQQTKGLLSPRGIVLHRKTCPNLQANKERYHNSINLRWNLKKATYLTRFSVLLENKMGALNLLFSHAVKAKLNILDMHTEKEGEQLQVELQFLTGHFKGLNRFVNALNKNPDYFKVLSIKIREDESYRRKH